MYHIKICEHNSYRVTQQYGLMNAVCCLYVWIFGGFTQLFEPVYLGLLPNLGIFQPYLFKYFLSLNLFSFWNYDETHRKCIVVPQVSEALFIFFYSIFSLLLVLDNFYSSIFRFTNSLLCYLCSAIYPIQWAFNFLVIVFYNSKISIWFSSIFICQEIIFLLQMCS